MARNIVRQAVWGGLLLIAATAAFAATNRPDGYTTICKIGETCSVSQSTNVAFGAAGQFVRLFVVPCGHSVLLRAIVERDGAIEFVWSRSHDIPPRHADSWQDAVRLERRI